MSATDLEALMASSQEAVAARLPLRLQAYLAGMTDPIARISDADFCTDACELVMAEFPALVGFRTSSDDAAVSAQGAVRWLIDGLTGWKQSSDPERAQLAAMLIMLLALGSCRDVLDTVPASIGTNAELLVALETIVSRGRTTMSPPQSAAVWEAETFAELQRADQRSEWKTVARIWPQLHIHMYNPLLNVAVRSLMRFDPDRLIRACSTLDSLTDGMLVAQTLDHEERLDIAHRSSNGRIRFYFVFSVLNEQPRVQLSPESETALATALTAIAQDLPEWTSWMEVFARYPVRFPAFHRAAGKALAGVPDDAVRIYVNIIELDIGYATGRDDLTAGLREFRNAATLQRRQLLWRLVFQRWHAWAFGLDGKDTTLSQIVRTELDYAVVGYCMECITEQERAGLLEDVLASLRIADHQWHPSRADMITWWFRGLSMLQPIQHAQNAASSGLDWLATREIYMPYDPDDAYARLRYGNVPVRRPQNPGDDEQP